MSFICETVIISSRVCYSIINYFRYLILFYSQLITMPKTMNYYNPVRRIGFILAEAFFKGTCCCWGTSLTSLVLILVISKNRT